MQVAGCADPAPRVPPPASVRLITAWALHTNYASRLYMTDIGRSRRIWRQSFFILLGASVLVIGILLIARSDKKVTYASESQDRAQQSIESLARLLEAQQPPVTRSNLLKELRRDNPKAKIFATDSTVSLGSLTFYFAKSGRLDRVGTTR